MRLLKEFYRTEGLDLKGKVIRREAVRAVVLEGDRVLMVYSPVNKDYKFPGGGIKEGESHQETLHRENQEECGVILAEIQDEFGFITEYARAREVEYDVYQQLSYYYLCTVHPGFIGQNLDEYERRLGFSPEWVSIEKALTKNRSVLKGIHGEPPRWTKRDTYVLARLAEMRIGTEGTRYSQEWGGKER